MDRNEDKYEKLYPELKQFFGGYFHQDWTYKKELWRSPVENQLVAQLS